MSLAVVTEVGKYSISRPDEANQTAEAIARMVEGPVRIVDCMACNGGNYIAFLDYDPSAVAIEYEKKEYDALVQNVSAAKKAHGELIHGSCVTFLKTLKPDTYNVLFFDPPWGGREYLNSKSIDMLLYDDGKELNFLEFIAGIVERQLVELIAIKAPLNWNLVGMETKLPKGYQITSMTIERGHYISYMVHFIHHI